MEINGILINNDVPSAIATQKLYTWTKYLMGEPHCKFRYGAVKPPIASQQWFPAAISPHITLIACCKAFPTPEAAVEWLKAGG